jgi:hypothetical protein
MIKRKGWVFFHERRGKGLGVRISRIALLVV